MNYIFISDFFFDTIKGGAEICNDVLISELRKDSDVITIQSREAHVEVIKAFKDRNFIIANFMNLSQQSKEYLQNNCSYIIYEHDHKYLKTRNPTPFPDYKAPSHMLVNQVFYNKAKCVIAQSQKHKEIVEKNLPCATVIEADITLYHDEQLDHLEYLNSNQYMPDVYMDGMFILNSDIQHKGTIQSVQYCEKNHLKYALHKGEWRSMMKFLYGSDGLVFFPQTFETMSRLVVEARMLNKKVICPSNIGAIHQSWFKTLKGNDLIQYHRENKTKFLDKIKNIFNSKAIQEPQKERADITTILTLYRRPHRLAEQVEAVRNQTKPPKEIWVWCNEPSDMSAEENEVYRGVVNGLVNGEYGDVKVFDCNENWKFYGRYAAGLLTNTKYVAIFDDDTIPGERWFENCLDTMRENPGIMGSAGVILKEDGRYNPHERVGWPTMNEETREVDLVGHAVFFEKLVLNALWSEEPCMFENGEDIQLSYAAQKFLGMKTFCPSHPPANPSLWGSLKGNEYGIDEVASSNNQQVSHQQFFSERDRCVQHCQAGGWKLVKG